MPTQTRPYKIRTCGLEELRAFVYKEKKTRKKKEKLPVIKRLHHRYSNEQRLLVILLAYGRSTDISRDSPFLRGPSEISKITGIRRNTIVEMLLSFHEKGGNYRKAYSTGRPAFPVPDDVVEFLQRENHTLRFLSLQQRCLEVQQHCNYPVYPMRLKSIYRRLGAKYTTAATVFKNRIDLQPQKQMDRYIFTKELVSLIMQVSASKTLLLNHRGV